MNKIIGIMIFVLLVTSCSNGKVDEGKIDATGDKLQKTIERVPIAQAQNLKD